MSFKTVKWGPDVPLSEANFKQMMDNDVYVKTVANATFGYGFYLWETRQEQTDLESTYHSTDHDLGFNSTATLTTFQVTNNNINNLWQCGVMIPKLTVTPSQTDDFENCQSVVVFKDQNQHVMNMVRGEPYYVPDPASSFGGWTVCAKFVAPLPLVGDQRVNVNLMANRPTQSFGLLVGDSSPAQIYMWNLGTPNTGYVI